MNTDEREAEDTRRKELIAAQFDFIQYLRPVDYRLIAAKALYRSLDSHGLPADPTACMAATSVGIEK